MQVPVRLVFLTRPEVSVGILLATAFSTLVFTATPFLIPLVAADYRLGLAQASLIGTCQLGGFVVGSWGAGRFLRPRRRVFIGAMAAAVVTNLAAGLRPDFAVLLALRAATGLSLGLVAWFGWVQVFGDERRMGDIATVGPIMGIVSGPAIALAATRGTSTVFVALGLLALVPLAFNRGSGATHRVPERTERTKPVPAAATLLGLLGLFTAGGSAVFQFAVVIATDEVGLPTAAVGLAFSLNAIAGVPAARYRGRRPHPGGWMILTSLCAVTMGLVHHRVVFVGAVMIWGFAFWMAIPGVFTVLGERSKHPADRAGDAQAVMAGGRVIGPLLGGGLLEMGGPTLLGVVGAATMAVAGLGVVASTILVPTQGVRWTDEPLADG